MKNREDKRKEVDSLRQELQRIQHLFVTGFEKLKVEEDYALRKAVRAVGGRYRVIKNNLAGKASERDNPLRDRVDLAVGQTCHALVLAWLSARAQGLPRRPGPRVAGVAVSLECRASSLEMITSCT